jgi:hypothetical protein
MPSISFSPQHSFDQLYGKSKGYSHIYLASYINSKLTRGKTMPFYCQSLSFIYNDYAIFWEY